MNFLKKILGINKEKQRNDSEAEQKASELRLYPRYPVAQFGLFTIEDEMGHQLQVHDISYGGLAIASCEQPHEWSETSANRVSLSNLSQKCASTLTPVHKLQHLIGYAFIHNNTDTLTFLRPCLEDLRLGYTLQPISEAWRKEEFRGKNWHLLRGDGPIDLMYKSNDAESRIVELQLTIRHDQQYHELRLSQDRWRSYHSIAEPGLAVRMVETNELDKNIVCRAVYIMVGAYSRFPHPPLDSTIKKLLLKLRAPSKQASA